MWNSSTNWASNCDTLWKKKEAVLIDWTCIVLCSPMILKGWFQIQHIKTEHKAKKKIINECWMAYHFGKQQQNTTPSCPI